MGESEVGILIWVYTEHVSHDVMDTLDNLSKKSDDFEMASNAILGASRLAVPCILFPFPFHHIQSTDYNHIYLCTRQPKENILLPSAQPSVSCKSASNQRSTTQQVILLGVEMIKQAMLFAEAGNIHDKKVANTK